MDAKVKAKERQELTDIYNSLIPPLKKQLLTTAKIIEDTQDIVLHEGHKKKNKINNTTKG